MCLRVKYPYQVFVPVLVISLMFLSNTIRPVIDANLSDNLSLHFQIRDVNNGGPYAFKSKCI